MRQTARRCALAALALGAAWSAAVAAETAPREMLAKMAEAARTGTYKGVVVYRSGEVLETLQVLHHFDDGTVREKLSSMTGDAREIYREDNEVICVLPREKRVTVDRRGQVPSLLPMVPPEAIDNLQGHYAFTEIGRSRVAGRPCRGVRIVPKDDYRYGYDFWIDEETSIPLRLSLIDRSGVQLEELLFTEVSYPETIPASAFKPEIDISGYRRVTQTVSQSPVESPMNWSIEKLPPGFELIMRDLREVPAKEGDVESIEHLLFSDGLSTVSVYSTPQAPPEQVFNGVSSMGAVHAYGRLLGRHQLTVVGEVPQATVEMIGQGIRRVTAESADAP